MPFNQDSEDFAGLFDGYPQAESYEAPESDKELSGRLSSWFDRASQAKAAYESDWELYRLYVKGDQLVVRHRDTGDIVKLTAEDSKRLRSVNNQLRPTARSLVGKLTRSIPTCSVLPATSDFEEQHGARTATQFLSMLRRKEDLDIKYLDVNNKLPWAGNAFMQLVWDRDAGQDIVFCEVDGFWDYNMGLEGTPCPTCVAQRTQELMLQQQQFQEQAASGLMALQEQMPEGVPAQVGDLSAEEVEMPPIQQMGPLPPDEEPPPLIPAKEGDIKIHVRDPRDVFVDPGVESVQDAQRLCFREVSNVSVVKQRFPEFAHVISSEQNLYTDRTAEVRHGNVDAHGEVEYLDDYCHVYEYHEAPTPQYPKGRLIYTVNGHVVGEMESPYHMIGRFPFYHFGFDKNDGEFWYEPFMAQAWHRQREINQVETQLREHVELLLKPKFFRAIGSRISADELTATTDQVISYNASAGRNYFEVPPPVPRDVWARGSQLAADIRQQAAVTEQEQGMTMSDVSGRAMAIIEAEADQQVGPIVIRNNAEWREMHRGALMLAKEYYHPKRLFMSVGAEGIQSFSFNEIRLSPGYDVQIEQEDGLSRNPAVRITQALDLLNAGVFTDMTTGVPDVKQFMQHAKINLPTAGYNMEATERAAASEVPYMIEKGQAHVPQLEDDPAIFSEELLGWLRGPGRRADPALRDQVREIWKFYTQWAVTGGPPAPVGGMEGGPTAGSGAGGPDMTAPGGTPNNPGHIPGGGRPIAAQAGRVVDQADRTAENQARIQLVKEG